MTTLSDAIAGSDQRRRGCGACRIGRSAGVSEPPREYPPVAGSTATIDVLAGWPRRSSRAGARAFDGKLDSPIVGRCGRRGCPSTPAGEECRSAIAEPVHPRWSGPVPSEVSRGRPSPSGDGAAPWRACSGGLRPRSPAFQRERVGAAIGVMDLHVPRRSLESALSGRSLSPYPFHRGRAPRRCARRSTAGPSVAVLWDRAAFDRVERGCSLASGAAAYRRSSGLRERRCCQLGG
jgi:hypothetical protein